jgi:hypothetical protein
LKGSDEPYRGKIDFAVVGAARSASTSLHNYLSQHPQIFMPAAKELGYFITGHTARSAHSLPKYYVNVRPGQVVGLSQANMLYFAHAPQRIYEHNQKAKLVAILRNPIDRAYSGYWYARSVSVEHNKSFEKALQCEHRGIAWSEFEGIKIFYLKQGHYAEQLRRYIEIFGKRQLRTLLTEYLGSAPQQVMSDLFEWLGVANEAPRISLHTRHNELNQQRISSDVLRRMSAPIWEPARKVIPPEGRRWVRQYVIDPLRTLNRTRFTPPPMNEETRARLRDYFRPHNAELEKVLNRDRSHWV